MCQPQVIEPNTFTHENASSRSNKTANGVIFKRTASAVRREIGREKDGCISTFLI